MMSETHWYDEDTFWETADTLLDNRRRWQAAPKEVEKVISLVKIKPGSRILDLGCGMGRHSQEFARRGHRVTGVDRTERYLEEARKRAEAEGLDIEYICDDMRNFLREGTFDTVLNLFTSFGYFEDKDDDRRVLSNVYQSLKPGGAFFMDVMGKEILARIYEERVQREENGVIIIEEPKIKDNWSRIENSWIILRGDEKRELSFSLRIYSAVELSDLLEEAGLEVKDVFGSLDGTPYDHKAERLIVLAEK